LPKLELEQLLGFEFGKRNLLVTFHPVTLEQGTAKDQFSQLLMALDEIKEVKIIFTKANADTDGRIINAMIDEYVVANPNRTISFASMGQLRYMSALCYVDAVVGNSSSGLIEAPSFNIGTINVGDRQKGRIKATSVIDCMPVKEEITNAFRKLYSYEFQRCLSCVVNPYGESGASKKIAGVLKTHQLAQLLKKKFNDIEISG